MAMALTWCAGTDIVGDQRQCIIWFKKASDQYIPEATYKLAQCYEDGWGCARDLAGAVDLYGDAAAGESCSTNGPFTIL